MAAHQLMRPIASRGSFSLYSRRPFFRVYISDLDEIRNASNQYDSHYLQCSRFFRFSSGRQFFVACLAFVMDLPYGGYGGF